MIRRRNRDNIQCELYNINSNNKILNEISTDKNDCKSLTPDHYDCIIQSIKA